MADGIFPSIVSKDRLPNVVGNPIYVSISDGTDTLLIDGSGNLNAIVNNGSGASAVNIQDGGNSITVDGTVAISGTVTVDTNFDYAVDSVAGATDVGALVLAVRDDVLATLTPADGDYVQVRTDSTGALWVHPTTSGDQSNVFADDSAFTIATSTVGAVGFLADETTPDSVDEGDIGIPRMTLDRKILVRITGATDANRWDIDASGLGQVDIAAHALTNANALPISKDNNANSELNPIFVQTVNTSTSGEEVHNYDTTTDVGSDATDNHDYTVAGTTFFLKSVIIAASGNMKAEIQTGPLASLTTKAVIFLNGRQGDTKQVTFDPPIEVPATSTGTVRVIRTNRQGAAMDVYSTIIGYDV